jgi:hypothetical protein
MEDLNHLFDPQVEYAAGDDADDLDMELAAAGQVLQKMAEAEGIDLESLPEQDVADLLTMIQSGELDGTSEVHNPQTKEASYQMSYNEITVADVAVELAKVASANGIDLDEVSREEYHEAFETLAEQMNDPAYFEKQAEFHEKLAEADQIGRYMAHAFLDELNDGGFAEKVARARWKVEADKAEGKTPTPGGTKRPQAGSSVPGGGPNSGFGKVDRIAEEARGASEQAAKERISARGKTDAARGKIREFAKEQYGRVARPVGRAALTIGRAVGVQNRNKAKLVGGALMAGGALGTAGVATGAGIGVKRMLDRDKAAFDESFEQDAAAYATHLLVQEGLIEPEYLDFSKFAQFAGDDYEDAVEQRALELLVEHGWL